MKTAWILKLAKKLGIIDRYDAERVKDIPALEVLMMQLMPKRCDSEVYLPDKLDVTELIAYVDRKNRENPELKLTVFHCIVFALARMMRERPRANRFVQGRKMYQRNEITVGFICKVKREDDAVDSLVIYTAEPSDDISAAAGKINRDIAAVRKAAGDGESLGDANRMVEKLARFPGFVLKLIFGVLRILDRIGADISFITKGDINYCSVLVSNLGSVGMSSIYHHLNNYGTNSMAVTLGVIHKEEVIYPDGTRAVRDILDMGTTVDERVADGFYFARSVQYLKKIIANPEMLDSTEL